MTNRKRKGISPIIATVLLIAITIAAGLAIYGWVSGLIGAGTNTHMPTSESATLTILDVTNTAATLQITNGGNFPIPINAATNVVVMQSGTGGAEQVWPSTTTGAKAVSVVVSAGQVPAGGTVIVTITNLQPGYTYTVTLTGLTDTNGNAVISGSVSFTTSPTTRS